MDTNSGFDVHFAQTGRTWPACPPQWTCWAGPLWPLVPVSGSLCAGVWLYLWGGRKRSGTSFPHPAAPIPVVKTPSKGVGVTRDGSALKGPWWSQCMIRLSSEKRIQEHKSLDGLSMGMSIQWEHNVPEELIHWTKIWMQHLKCCPYVSWAEIKDPRNVLYAQKAYFSQILYANLFASLLVSISPFPI